MIRGFSIFCFAFVFSGCLSVNLKPEAGSPISRIHHTPPNGYTPINIKSNGHHYQSTQTGNIIGITSRCPSHQDTSINDLANSLVNSKTQKLEESLVTDARPVVLWKIHGLKEGLPFTIEAARYEKFGCALTTFYMAQTEKFDSEADTHRKLIQSLRAEP